MVLKIRIVFPWMGRTMTNHEEAFEVHIMSYVLIWMLVAGMFPL